MWRVIVIQVIDTDDLITASQQGCGCVHADETCCTGDKNPSHVQIRCKLWRKRRILGAELPGDINEMDNLTETILEEDNNGE